MTEVTDAIEGLSASKFTGKVTLHFHLGAVKKITREEDITPKKEKVEEESPKDVAWLRRESIILIEKFYWDQSNGSPGLINRETQFG